MVRFGLVTGLTFGTSRFVDIYIFKPCDDFADADPVYEQHVWFREVTEDDDKTKISCMIGNSFALEWACVTTWVGYQVSFTNKSTYSYTFIVLIQQ